MIDSMQTPGSRLKYVRTKILKLSRKELAQKYNLSINTLVAWENKFSSLSEQAIKKCIDIFFSEEIIVTREWVLLGSGPNPRLFYDINRYNQLQERSPLNLSTNDDFILLSKEIEFFTSSTSNAIVQMISNDDMLPVYNKGDYVGGRLRYEQLQIEECIGLDCIVEDILGDRYIKRLSRKLGSNKYNLTCLNYSTTSLEPTLYGLEIRAVAPIIWHRKVDGLIKKF